jgi:hypothetical protein
MIKKDYELIAKAIAHARAEIHRTSEAGTTEKIKQLQGQGQAREAHPIGERPSSSAENF